jgi:hypothetical protein
MHRPATTDSTCSHACVQNVKINANKHEEVPTSAHSGERRRKQLPRRTLIAKGIRDLGDAKMGMERYV